jgi:hypothetical protein
VGHKRRRLGGFLRMKTGPEWRAGRWGGKMSETQADPQALRDSRKTASGRYFLQSVVCRNLVPIRRQLVPVWVLGGEGLF